MEKILPEIDIKTRYLSGKFDGIPCRDNTNKTIARNENLLIEFIDYSIEKLPEDPKEEDIDRFRRYIEKDIEDGEFDEITSAEVMAVILEESINCALRHKVNTRISALFELRDRFKELEVIVRATVPIANFDLT